MIKLFPTTSNVNLTNKSAPSPDQIKSLHMGEENEEIRKLEKKHTEEINTIVSDYDEKIKKLLTLHDKELESLKIKYESILKQKESIISNITEQYNELMTVAQSYKKDAAKWYSMVCKRH